MKKITKCLTILFSLLAMMSLAHAMEFDYDGKTESYTLNKETNLICINVAHYESVTITVSYTPKDVLYYCEMGCVGHHNIEGGWEQSMWIFDENNALVQTYTVQSTDVLEDSDYQEVQIQSWWIDEGEEVKCQVTYNGLLDNKVRGVDYISSTSDVIAIDMTGYYKCSLNFVIDDETNLMVQYLMLTRTMRR